MTRLLIAITLIVFAFSAQAQGVGANVQTLNDYNKLQPLQNPQYERAEKILDRRILDSKNRVVGEVNDVIVGPNGSISALEVEFDRLRLNAPVYLNYRDMEIRTGGKSYILKFDQEQITSLYPEILAQVDTAAGALDDLSVSKLKDSEILAHDGRKIGQVSEILFSADGDRVEAIYVGLTTGVLRGKSVAIPLRAAQFGTDSAQKINGIVSNEMADAMIEYASKH